VGLRRFRSLPLTSYLLSVPKYIAFSQLRQRSGRQPEAIRKLAYRDDSRTHKPRAFALPGLKRRQQLRGDLVFAGHLTHALAKAEAGHHQKRCARRKLGIPFELSGKISHSTLISRWSLRKHPEA